MERRQLEYVLAVVEHGGFTNASRVLHVTQPSLSYTVRIDLDGPAPSSGAQDDAQRRRRVFTSQ